MIVLVDLIDYQGATFHLILFPVPDKKTVVDKFINTAKFLRGEE